MSKFWGIQGTWLSGTTGSVGMTGSPGAQGAQGFTDDTYASERFLLEKIKSEYGITNDDLRDFSKVKSKIREKNIDQIIA